MKYGICIPQNKAKAKLIDDKNGDTMWQDAINKEMKNVAIAFELVPKNEKPDPEYKYWIPSWF